MRMSGKSVIIFCMIAGIIGIIVFFCTYKGASVVVSDIEKRNAVVEKLVKEAFGESGN